MKIFLDKILILMMVMHAGLADYRYVAKVTAEIAPNPDLFEDSPFILESTNVIQYNVEIKRQNLSSKDECSIADIQQEDWNFDDIDSSEYNPVLSFGTLSSSEESFQLKVLKENSKDVARRLLTPLGTHVKVKFAGNKYGVDVKIAGNDKATNSAENLEETQFVLSKDANTESQDPLKTTFFFAVCSNDIIFPKVFVMSQEECEKKVMAHLVLDGNDKDVCSVDGMMVAIVFKQLIPYSSELKTKGSSGENLQLSFDMENASMIQKMSDSDVIPLNPLKITHAPFKASIDSLSAAISTDLFRSNDFLIFDSHKESKDSPEFITLKKTTNSESNEEIVRVEWYRVSGTDLDPWNLHDSLFFTGQEDSINSTGCPKKDGNVSEEKCGINDVNLAIDFDHSSDQSHVYPVVVNNKLWLEFSDMNLTFKQNQLRLSSVTEGTIRDFLNREAFGSYPKNSHHEIYQKLMNSFQDLNALYLEKEAELKKQPNLIDTTTKPKDSHPAGFLLWSFVSKFSLFLHDDKKITQIGNWHKDAVAKLVTNLMSLDKNFKKKNSTQTPVCKKKLSDLVKSDPTGSTFSSAIEFLSVMADICDQSKAKPTLLKGESVFNKFVEDAFKSSDVPIEQVKEQNPAFQDYVKKKYSTLFKINHLIKELRSFMCDCGNQTKFCSPKKGTKPTQSNGQRLNSNPYLTKPANDPNPEIFKALADGLERPIKFFNTFLRFINTEASTSPLTEANLTFANSILLLKKNINVFKSIDELMDKQKSAYVLLHSFYGQVCAIYRTKCPNVLAILSKFAESLVPPPIVFVDTGKCKQLPEADKAGNSAKEFDYMGSEMKKILEKLEKDYESPSSITAFNLNSLLCSLVELNADILKLIGLVSLSTNELLYHKLELVDDNSNPVEATETRQTSLKLNPGDEFYVYAADSKDLPMPIFISQALENPPKELVRLSEELYELKQSDFIQIYTPSYAQDDQPLIGLSKEPVPHYLHFPGRMKFENTISRNPSLLI